MIDELIKNIDVEIDLLRGIAEASKHMEDADLKDKAEIEKSITSLMESMKIVNASIPAIVNNISAARPLYDSKEVPELERVSVQTARGTMSATLNKGDRERFLAELNINESLLKRMKESTKVKVVEESDDFKKSRGYLKYSNRYFLNYSKGWIGKGYFRELATDIRKANMDILFESYVAMMFFSSFWAFFVGILMGLFLLFFNIGFTFPFVSTYGGSIASRLIYLLLLPIILPVATFLVLNYYPSTEKGTLSKRIDQELPFAVIHMSSISGSGIEPTQIFRIIGLSKEYPYLRKEIRKVLNQINIYGYDLVTALNNVAKSTPSEKLSELFSGLATTISSGGDISEFLEKRAESLMLSYRLEREKFGKLAETFMDIYISVVIATPMILMLLMVILSVSAPDLGFTPTFLTVAIVGAVAIINIFFLIFLHLKQPAY